MIHPAQRGPLPRTTAEFLAWPGDGRAKHYQLVDGEVRAMAPASAAHGLIQVALASMIRQRLVETGSRCRVIAEMAVTPKMRSDANVRVPDLGVTCSPTVPGQMVVPDPVLLVEILSPSDRVKTWTNVWAFSTIPSLQEILIVHSTKIAGHLLRRNVDGSWPDVPAEIGPDDVLQLDSVDLTCPMAAIYADTHLART